MYRIHTRSLSLNSAFIAAAHPDATSHLARARDMSTLGFYFRQYIGFILSLARVRTPCGLSLRHVTALPD